MGAPPARPRDGYFFEDFEPGARLVHAAPRTLTEADAALYLALTGDRNPVHCAAPVARALGHRARPLDDLLVFHVAFGKTVHDVSYNAVANLGYADVRFLAPVYPGDTLRSESEVLGVKRNSSGKSGVVWVRSRAFNGEGAEVLAWARWVMVATRGAAREGETASPAPELPREVAPGRLAVAPFLRPRALDPRDTGGERWWDDYEPGETIDHPGAMTLEEADHMLATRLYQNSARVHFDAFGAREGPFGKRLVYGGHVISVCRSLSRDGLENAFAIAAIHGGSHTNPAFAGDTILARTVVLARDAIPGRDDVGALRVRMIGAKNARLAGLATPPAGAKDPAVVLDLDLSLLLPRRSGA